MPYCRECGSRFEEEAGACKSCGAELTVNDGTGASSVTEDSKVEPVEAGESILTTAGKGPEEPAPSLPDESPKKPEIAVEIVKSNNNPVFEKIMDDFMRREGSSLGSHRNQIESHLGKGLIKPVAVENCMDGYHFKYDEPPRQSNKPELQNEKIVEFRVSGEPEPGTANKTSGEMKNKTDEAEAKTIEAEAVAPELDLEKGDRAVPEPEAGPGEAGPGTEPKPASDRGDSGADETDRPQEEAEGLPEKETDSEAVEAKPEFGGDTPPEVVWEGRRTWYGLTLNEFYRLTDRAAIVLKEDGSKFTEVDWESVSAINIKQNWLAKLLNIGNLEITGANSGPLLILEGIENPERVRERLVKILDFKV